MHTWYVIRKLCFKKPTRNLVTKLYEFLFSQWDLVWKKNALDDGHAQKLSNWCKHKKWTVTVWWLCQLMCVFVCACFFLISHWTNDLGSIAVFVHSARYSHRIWTEAIECTPRKQKPEKLRTLKIENGLFPYSYCV